MMDWWMRAMRAPRVGDPGLEEGKQGFASI
jgi:hypothetical protein